MFAEYFSVLDADTTLAKIPDGVSLEQALMSVDMMTTGFTGAESANIKVGDCVCVIGIGPVGLMAVAAARHLGAARIIAVGSRPRCVDLAKRYGASDVISYKDGNIVELVLDMTDGVGPDSVIIAGGGDSVFSQACSYPLQVVAVDDGSVDGSPAILDAWRERGLEVIRQENAGAAAARNRALECCRAEYVLFLDADDALVPGCLEPAIRLAREEDADLVECAYTTVDAEGRPMRVFSHPEGPMSPRDCTGFPHGKLFRARLFTRLGFPAGYLFEDSVLAQLVYPLLEQSGGKSLGLNRQMLYYRVHAANTSHKNLVRPKSIDSLWITLSLFRDRQTLGLVADARYYEYLLNMLVLTMHRTERLGDEVRRAEFAVFRELLGELSGFSTGRPAWRALESAVAAGDYGKARLFCSLH